jgi:DNA invertase Pin-like site-specific DNA recombinase
VVKETREGCRLSVDLQLHDSDKRQRAAIGAYAKAAGYEIIETFYDAAVSRAPMSDGARTMVVESPDRRSRCDFA